MGGSKLPEAARMIHSANVQMMVGCTKRDWCAETREMAKSPKYYAETPGSGPFSRFVVNEYQRHSLSFKLRQLELTQHMPSGLDYVADSAQPEPTLETREGRTLLRWVWEDDPVAGQQDVTYRVSPSQEGVWTIAGQMSFVDAAEYTRTLPLPSMAITVTGPCGPPTPIPTATDTPEPPTETPVPPTDTPTPTATPAVRPVFLPLLLGDYSFAVPR